MPPRDLAPNEPSLRSAPGSPIDASPENPGQREASPWPTFFVASVAIFMVSMDTTVLYAAFAALRASFPDSSPAQLSWVINAYTVVYAAMLIPAGGLADARGRKRCFLWGIGLFLIGSVGSGLAPSVPWLVCTRVVQALGAALLTPASLAIVLAAFPVTRRAMAVSLWGAAGALAASLGPGLGSLIIDHAGWPWAFFFNVGPGLWALWRGRTVLVESVRRDVVPRLDLVGIALIVSALGAIAAAIVQTQGFGWGSGGRAVMAALGVTCLLLFVAWVQGRPHALVDLALFRIRSFSLANLAMLCFSTAFALMFFGFFFHLTAVWGYSISRAGLAVMPGPTCVAIVATLSGRVAGRHGHRPLLLAGSVLYALAGLWFLLVPSDQPDYLRTWLPGVLLSGVAVGMMMPSLAGAAVSALPGAHFAVGGAVNQAIRQIGSVIGVALIIALLGTTHDTHADYVAVYLAQITLSCLAGLCCLGIRTAPRRPA